MKISTATLSLAFIAKTASAFTLPSTSTSLGTKTASNISHHGSCPCSSCTRTALFADVTEEVPAEVEAMDGIESNEEEHNAERPQRQQLKKKSKGKDLSEFEAGSMVTGTVKSIASYGAFVDIGASTDGLLHISQLSSGYVASVGEIVSEGQEVEVRIISIDSGKGQIALSMMTEEEASADRPPQRKQRQGNRRDDSAVLSALSEKGWETTKFVEGTVVSTVDFGAFVKVDAKTLNEECEGEFDGLVHISALAAGRVNSVTDVVNANEKVQVRCKSIQGGKVSLTMISVEDEESKSSSSGYVQEGAKDWKESVEKLTETMPVFKNGPIVENRRKE